MPVIEAGHLQCDDWLKVFRSQRPWQAAIDGDRTRWVEGPLSDASVLVALTERGGLLLTERSRSMRHHPGQVALPGGRIEASDRDARQAAYREAFEEIGLDSKRLQDLGRLPSYLTGSGYKVQPVVAWVHGSMDLHRDLSPDPGEVAAIFEVPLNFIFDPRHHRRHYWQAPEGQRAFYSIPWHCKQPERMRFCDVLPDDAQAFASTGMKTLNPAEHEFFIWGATAAMLRNFYLLLHAHRDLFPAAP